MLALGWWAVRGFVLRSRLLGDDLQISAVRSSLRRSQVGLSRRTATKNKRRGYWNAPKESGRRVPW